MVSVGDGSNSIEQINLSGVLDNGIYNVSGNLSVGTLRYSGSDEPIVVIGGDLSLGTAIIDAAGNSVVGVNGCGDVYVGSIVLKRTNVETLFKTRGDDPVRSLTIGRISGEIAGTQLFYMGRADTQSLSIGEIDVTYYHTEIGVFGGWVDLLSCQGFTIGSVNVRLIDETDSLTSANIFRGYFPKNPTKISRIGEFNVDILRADGVTPSDAQFFGHDIIHPNIFIGKGMVRTNSGPYLEKVRSSLPNDKLYVNNEPTLGTWRRGQIVYRAYPNAAGSPGWVCVEAGSPGVWKMLPAVQA